MAYLKPLPIDPDRLLTVLRAEAGPRALSTEDAAQVRERHANGRHPANELAERFGVSRATIYRVLKT